VHTASAPRDGSAGAHRRGAPLLSLPAGDGPVHDMDVRVDGLLATANHDGWSVGLFTIPPALLAAAPGVVRASLAAAGADAATSKAPPAGVTVALLPAQHAASVPSASGVGGGVGVAVAVPVPPAAAPVPVPSPSPGAANWNEESLDAALEVHVPPPPESLPPPYPPSHGGGAAGAAAAAAAMAAVLAAAGGGGSGGDGEAEADAELQRLWARVAELEGRRSVGSSGGGGGGGGGGGR
jgi:hypothetical protein